MFQCLHKKTVELSQDWLVHQHGCCFIVLEHKCGWYNVMCVCFIVPDLLKCSSFVASFSFWLHSYMIGCQGYPRCRASAFFPKFVIEAAVHESVCQRCQPGDVHKISFKFKRGSVPPMMPLEWVLKFPIFKSGWKICWLTCVCWIPE